MKRSPVIAALVLLVLATTVQMASAQTTLHVASWFPADDPDAMALEAIEQFEAEHPDVNVEWETIPWGDYWEKIPVRLASGTGPDILMVTFAEMDISWMKLGIFEPLDRFVQGAEGIDLSDFDEPVLAGGTMDGKLYYIPSRVGFLAWIYNRQLLDQAGLAEPGYSWTWSDLLAYTKRLTQRNGDGTAQVYGTSVSTWPLNIYEFIFGAGGQIFSEPDTVLPNEAVYNRPNALEGFSFYANLVNEHQVAPAPGEGTYRLEDGTIAIQQSGTHVLADLPTQAPDLEFGVTLAPRGDVPYVAQGGGTGYGISAQSEQKEMAWALIKKLLSTEVLVKIGRTDSAMVTRKSARAELGMELWHNRLWLEAGKYFDPVKVVGFDEVLVQPLGQAMERALNKEAPYEQLLDEAVRQSNLALEEWRDQE